MRRRTKPAWEKLVFGAALAGAAMSGAWSWRLQRASWNPPDRATLPNPVGPAYQMRNWHSPRPAGEEWPAPLPQSRGSGWLYEVFTPPALKYQATEGSFALVSSPAAVAPEEPGGRLKLLAVQRMPFRLQLAGYFGAPDDPLAAFVSPRWPETILTRPGHRFVELGLTFRRFEVRKVVVGQNEAGPVWEIVAIAVLHDESAGAEVELDSRARRLTDTPLAVFKLAGSPAETRKLFEGDSFTIDGASYQIARIQLDPPEVVIMRDSPGGAAREEQVLRPPVAAIDEAAPPNPLPPASTTVARNDPGLSSP